MHLKNASQKYSKELPHGAIIKTCLSRTLISTEEGVLQVSLISFW